MTWILFCLGVFVIGELVWLAVDHRYQKSLRALVSALNNDLSKVEWVVAEQQKEIEQLKVFRTQFDETIIETTDTDCYKLSDGEEWKNQ